jgi:hypothetical protein
LGMQQVLIRSTIAEFTYHARKHAHVKALKINPRAKGAEVEAHRVVVNKLCDEMEALGERTDSLYSEFEALLHKMGPDFPPTPPDYSAIVANAFEAAGRLAAQRQEAA